MRNKRLERVVLNISGEVFETFGKTLKRFPETLLGDFNKRRRFYCLQTQQYFFNRSRLCFGAILYFYQSSGMLSCPPGISIDVFEAECKFFEIPDGIIKRMKTKEGIIPELQGAPVIAEGQIMRPKTYKQLCWDFLENPETSSTARTFAIFSLFAILLSILSACLETIKVLRVTSNKLSQNPWSIAELVLNTWFLIELVLRFMSAPKRGEFLRSTLNWIDGFAVIPYFVIFFTSDKVTSLGFLRILRFIRVIRLFRLSKHSKRLKVVGEIIKSSFGDFQLLMLCLAMLIIFGGSLMYYIEGLPNKSSAFESIPISLWWAIQTITTLGYGDITPVTAAGQLLSACFMAFGALTISLPVLSIVTKFMTLYAKNIESDTCML